MNTIRILDDPDFPIFGNMIMESCSENDRKNEDPTDKKSKGILEEAGAAQDRARAMSAVISWAGDGEYSYENLDEYICAVADIDGDFEISDEEEDYYNQVWQQASDAMLTLGADIKDVEKMVNNEDAAAAQRVGEAITASLEEESADDDDLIAGFAYGEDAVLENADDDEGRHMVLEAAYKKRKVVRDGKVVVVRKRVSGKVRLSAAQKASLRKARRKANSGAAKLARRKSMRVRRRRGL